MRDYSRFDKCLDRLLQDVYAQPPDRGHTEWATDVVQELCTIPRNISSVLDVGCGQGFLSEAFEAIGLKWTGVTIGEDYRICESKGLNVRDADMSFLPFEDNTFDLVFARHVLEHSPFPVITLMEWRRVCKGWLVLVAPSPDYWGWSGKNHYSVMSQDQLNWLLQRAGWKAIHSQIFTNRDDNFMKHWKVLQQARFEKGDEGEAEVFKANPDVDVEYRMLLEKVEPTLE